MRRIGALTILAVAGLLTVAPASRAQDGGSAPTSANVGASTFDVDPCGPTRGTRYRTTLTAVVTPTGAETTASFDVTTASGTSTVPATPAPGAGLEGVKVTAETEGPGIPVRVELVTTNAQGTTRTPATLGFATPGCAAPPAVPISDATAPTLSAVKLPASIKRGTVLRMAFTASEASSVRLVVERRRSGRVTGKGCSAKAKRGKKCVAYVAVASSLVPASAGAVTASVPAGASGKRLSAGRYRVMATPTDAAGNVGRVTTVHVTVK